MICVLYNALRTEMSLRIGGFATLLQVFDMPTSLAFYRDVLGFDVVRFLMMVAVTGDAEAIRI